MILSIIVPVFNGESCIERCVSSLLRTTYQDMEIIIVDDGSTDSTAVVCRKIVSCDSRVVYYRINNSGVSVARNYGLRKATGRYIMFVDSDDAVINNYINCFLDGAGDEDLLLAGYSTYDLQSRVITNKYVNCSCKLKMEEFCCEITKWLSPPYLLSPWGKMFKRDLINNNSIVFPEDMSYGEDVVFVLQYLNVCRSVRCIEDAGYIYSIGGTNNLSGRFNAAMIDCDVLGIQLLRELLTKNGSTSYEKICSNRLRVCFTLFAKRLMNANISYDEKKRIFYEKASIYAAKKNFTLRDCASKGESIVAIALKSCRLFGILYLLKR